jgi:hypothetical protein
VGPHNSRFSLFVRVLPAWYAAESLQHLTEVRTASRMRLTQVSPMAWQHVHLCGRYECTKAPERMNMAAIMQALA